MCNRISLGNYFKPGESHNKCFLLLDEFQVSKNSFLLEEKGGTESAWVQFPLIDDRLGVQNSLTNRNATGWMVTRAENDKTIHTGS